ncbi:MAG: hypothetical protein GYA21_02020 [Myxococcales bacterium]|nr:hypothetical protein [Myxococcales bacterium]
MKWALALGASCWLGCGGSEVTDRCQNKVCDEPPADFCRNESVLAEYAGTGTCDPKTGECQYQSTDRTCAQGCADGACRGESQTVFGYIAIFEAEVMWFAGSDWFKGVGAYFADQPSYYRYLPHQLEWFCTEAASAGSCRLYSPCARVVVRYDQCDPRCGEDQWCDNQSATCQPLPRHYDVGEISVSGTHAAISLPPDAMDRYALASPPADLFDAGATIQASAPGGALGAISLSAPGVAPLSADAQVELLAGSAARFRWQSTGDGSRVRLILLGGLHDPAPPVGISCDAEDSAGELEIPAALVDGFRQRTLVIQKPSYAMRYQRAAQTAGAGEIELMVGSVKDVHVCLSAGCR